MTSALIAVLLIAGPALTLADGTSTRRAAASIVAVPLPPSASAMQIDGELTEDIWARVPAASGFRQRDPKEGAPGTFDTSVRVAFDDTALYIAVDATDPEPSKIVGLLTRRDENSPSDWVRVMIDSYSDRRTAYEFAVNAAGVKQDIYWFNDGSTDTGWDAVWEVAVSRHAQGWRAEFRIPFSQLRFNPASGQTFGFAVLRHVPRISETTTWPLVARSVSGFVSQFGDLSGLSFSAAPRRLELMPYALARVTTSAVGTDNPLRSPADPSATVGLDLKYALAPGLTLTGTINPDFGQVEADPAVVNLSGFETFFAERRPFFVEGSGNFAFDVDCNDGQCTGIFYSRRIGRQPQRGVRAPEGGHAASPDSTTILGAAKITGRIGRFSIGVLNAVTSREDARLAVRGAGGFDRRETPVEPATNYFLARASREFANQSRIGFMATSTNRSLPDELRFLPGSAVTGGIDADIRLGRRFSVSGFLAGSTVRGSTEAISRIQRSTVHSYQRPDADHVEFDPARTSLGGHAGKIFFNKIAGRKYRFSSGAAYKSPGFEINDLGFQSRADEIAISNWHQLTWDQPGTYVRRKNVNFNQWAGWNMDGDLRYSGGNINSHWTFTNNWNIGSGLNYNARGFADRLTRGGPGGYVNPGWSQWGYVNTDTRRRLMADFSGSWFNDLHGSRNWYTSLTSTYRPASNLLARVGVDYSRNHDESQWITNLAPSTGAGPTRYVFGALEQTTVGISARLNYTITPQLTVQLFARPFVSAGDYSRFKELVNGRARRYEERYAPFAYEGNPDFNVRSFRTTNVLRWEYRPGSVLFIVWQQGRDGFSTDGRFRFGSNFSEVFEADATNVFLIKFSRWLNF